MLARFGRVDENGDRYFHMTEMVHRTEEVGFFYGAMRRHIPLYVSARYNRSDYERARRRIYIPGAWVGWDAPRFYWVAFQCLMDKFQLEREQLAAHLIPVDETIQFHMDETYDSKFVNRIWPEYLQNRSYSMRSRYGDVPIFENDKTTLPLQAADLWAWWVRQWCDSGEPERIGKHDFAEFVVGQTKKRPRVTIDIAFTEDDFLSSLERMASSQTAGRNILVLPRSISEVDAARFSSTGQVAVENRSFRFGLPPDERAGPKEI